MRATARLPFPGDYLGLGMGGMWVFGIEKLGVRTDGAGGVKLLGGEKCGTRTAGAGRLKVRGGAEGALNLGGFGLGGGAILRLPKSGRRGSKRGVAAGGGPGLNLLTASGGDPGRGGGVKPSILHGLSRA